MVSPYPIPSINVNGSSVIAWKLFVHVKKDEKAEFDDGILITGILNNETVEIPIENIELLAPNTGCENTILPLFAFNYIKNIEQKHIISEIDKKNVIEVSISSGVLSKFTGYVGMIKLEPKYDKIYVQLDCCCSYARALRCYDVYDDSKLETIEEDAFSGSSIEVITIPSKLINLNVKCFYEASKLNKIIHVI